MKPTFSETRYQPTQEGLRQPDPLKPGYKGTHSPPASYKIRQPQPGDTASARSSEPKPDASSASA